MIFPLLFQFHFIMTVVYNTIKPHHPNTTTSTSTLHLENTAIFDRLGFFQITATDNYNYNCNYNTTKSFNMGFDKVSTSSTTNTTNTNTYKNTNTTSSSQKSSLFGSFFYNNSSNNSSNNGSNSTNQGKDYRSMNLWMPQGM